MKNSARTVPIRSTSSRVTKTPLNGMTTSGTMPATLTASSSARVRVTVAVPGSLIGKQSSAGRCSVSTAGPQKSNSPRCRSKMSRQSGVGSPSSSISQAKLAPKSCDHCRPVWKPPAPPKFVGSVRHNTRGSALVSSANHSPVPSLDALSTTRMASTASSVRSRETRRCSSASRLKVTTTAATSRPCPLLICRAYRLVSGSGVGDSVAGVGGVASAGVWVLPPDSVPGLSGWTASRLRRVDFSRAARCAISAWVGMP